jgi:hypothetical protein
MLVDTLYSLRIILPVQNMLPGQMNLSNPELSISCWDMIIKIMKMKRSGNSLKMQ